MNERKIIEYIWKHFGNRIYYMRKELNYVSVRYINCWLCHMAYWQAFLCLTFHSNLDRFGLDCAQKCEAEVEAQNMKSTDKYALHFPMNPSVFHNV